MMMIFTYVLPWDLMSITNGLYLLWFVCLFAWLGLLSLVVCLFVFVDIKFCSVQLSMCYTEKWYRNNIISINVIFIIVVAVNIIILS